VTAHDEHSPDQEHHSSPSLPRATTSAGCVLTSC
jgi:hypothetical protein